MKKSPKHPDDPLAKTPLIATVVPAWEETYLLARLNECRRMLEIHGLLTEAESIRVRRRTSTMLEKQHQQILQEKGNQP